MPKTDVRVFPTRHFLINVPVFFCRNSETSCGPKRILNGLTIRNVFLEREREREKLRLYSYHFFKISLPSPIYAFHMKQTPFLYNTFFF